MTAKHHQGLNYYRDLGFCLAGNACVNNTVIYIWLCISYIHLYIIMFNTISLLISFFRGLIMLLASWFSHRVSVCVILAGQCSQSVSWKQRHHGSHRNEDPVPGTGPSRRLGAAVQGWAAEEGREGRLWLPVLWAPGMDRPVSTRRETRPPMRGHRGAMERLAGSCRYHLADLQLGGQGWPGSLSSRGHSLGIPARCRAEEGMGSLPPCTSAPFCHHVGWRQPAESRGCGFTSNVYIPPMFLFAPDLSWGHTGEGESQKCGSQAARMEVAGAFRHSHAKWNTLLELGQSLDCVLVLFIWKTFVC